MLAQRPRIGLSGIVYAVLTETSDVIGGTPVWGAVNPLSQAAQLDFDTASSLATLFADNALVQVGETTGEMKAGLTLTDVLPADLNTILGHAYVAGQLFDKVTDQSPWVAIGAKILRVGQDSGNPVYEYVWLYKCKFAKPKVSSKTKGASISFDTVALEGRVAALNANGAYRARVRTDDQNALAATITNWFNQPVLPSADINPLNVAIAKSSTNVAFTFTKTGGGLITLNAANLNVNTLPVFKGSSGAPQAGSYAISGNGTATVVVTFTPTTAFGTAYVSAAAAGVIDQNAVAVTPQGAVLSFP